MNDSVVLAGGVVTWSSNGAVREYMTVTLPFADARRAVRAVEYSAETGAGEQRGVQHAHANMLKAAMAGGTYTPTPLAAGLRDSHRARVTRDGGTATLAVDPADPLPLVDGLQRLTAMGRLLTDAAGDPVREAEALALPVTLTVYLDGDTRTDFLNLNQGKPLDPTHKLALQAVADRTAVEVRAGLAAAKALNARADGPFHRVVRLDARGVGQPGALVGGLPAKTLAATGGSDLATSLVGLARVGGAGATAEWLAGVVTAAHRAVRDRAPDLLAAGTVLTPPDGDGATKGSATMLVGLGVCLAHRLKVLGRAEAEAADLDRLAGAARKTLAEAVGGSFPSGRKRDLMRRFAAAFLADLPGDKLDGVPADLVKVLGRGAFGVKAGPRPKARRKAGPKATPKAAEVVAPAAGADAAAGPVLTA